MYINMGCMLKKRLGVGNIKKKYVSKQRRKMNVFLRKNLELLVGVCSGIAIAYSDAIPFLGGICAGILLECAHPGLCGSIGAFVATGCRTPMTTGVQEDCNKKRDDETNDEEAEPPCIVTNERGVMLTTDPEKKVNTSMELCS